jgi:hypothetical protein
MEDDRKARVERLVAEIEAVEAVEELPPLPASAEPAGGLYEDDADDPENGPLEVHDHTRPPVTASDAGAPVSVTGPFTYLDSESGEPPPVRGDTR